MLPPARRSRPAAATGGHPRQPVARIAEAEREGWVGEAEGLKVSLAAANNKLAQIELALARRAENVSLGIPSYPDTAACVITDVPGPCTREGTP